MSHADMSNCCGFKEAAASFSWNSPKKAINPYLDPAEVAPVSALSNLITLYAADNEQEQLRREALSDQVWERYFFNESRDVQEAAADQGACAPWTRGNNCPLAENLNQQEKDKSADGDTRTDITRMDDKELHDYLHSMSKKERRELAARLRLVKPKRRKDYKQRITDHQRLQLVYELKSRGFDGSEKEVDLLLRGGSIPSGAGLRIFYRNQRLQEDDKWRNLY